MSKRIIALCLSVVCALIMCMLIAHGYENKVTNLENRIESLEMELDDYKEIVEHGKEQMRTSNYRNFNAIEEIADVLGLDFDLELVNNYDYKIEQWTANALAQENEDMVTWLCEAISK